MIGKLEIPLVDKKIAEKFDPYLVGGSVRDYLLGREFNDFDITVSDLDGFLRCIKKKNPKIIVFPLSEEDREYRCVIGEGLWLDVSAIKGKEIFEDLSLRDFTFNSIALKVVTGEVLDPHGGVEDISRGLIRAISSRNLIADPLRILRAYRFHALLQFSIEEVTRSFLREFAPLVSTRIVAGERVRYELFLILNSDKASKTLNLMAEDGVLFSIFPELRALKFTSQRYYNEQNLLFHTLDAVAKIEEILRGRDYEPDVASIVKLALLLHDIGKPSTISFDEEGNTHFYGHDRVGSEMVDNISERLRLSRKERSILKKLVRHHMYPHLLAAQRVLTDKAVNRYLRRMEEFAFPLLDMALADALASPPRGEGILPYDDFSRRILKILEEKKKLGPGRILTGDDLIALGLKPGPLFKHILAEIDDLVAEGKVKTREDALEYVKSNYISQ